MGIFFLNHHIDEISKKRTCGKYYAQLKDLGPVILNTDRKHDEHDSGKHDKDHMQVFCHPGIHIGGNAVVVDEVCGLDEPFICRKDPVYIAGDAGFSET